MRGVRFEATVRQIAHYTLRSGELSIDYSGLPLLNTHIPLGEDLLKGLEVSRIAYQASNPISVLLNALNLSSMDIPRGVQLHRA
jgi:hypothetical protein